MVLNYQLQPKNLIGVLSVHVSFTYDQCEVKGREQRRRYFYKGPERHT